MVLNERLDLKTNLQSGFRLKKALHKVLELFFYWGGHIDPHRGLEGKRGWMLEECGWSKGMVFKKTSFDLFIINGYYHKIEITVKLKKAS